MDIPLSYTERLERKLGYLTGCYHHKKHKKDKSCDGKDRCHYTESCVTNHTKFKVWKP